MNELLNLAINAHGGLDRWKKVKSVEATASITGAIWYVKGRPDVLKNVVVTSETGPERVTMTFTGEDKRSTFEPGRVVIENSGGTLIEARDNPEASFDGQQQDTPWDDIHVAYFSGEALWTYLNTPFLYARSDFTTEEISCFGPDGLLRRHDYTVDILQGGTGLNYASGYEDVDGIIVPATRRVYAYEGDYQLVKEPLLVAIDLSDIKLASGLSDGWSGGRTAGASRTML